VNETLIASARDPDPQHPKAKVWIWKRAKLGSDRDKESVNPKFGFFGKQKLT
jgi:hypothetical protein